MNKERELCLKVKKLCEKEGVSFFFVTDGASIYYNNGNPAVKNAREAHIKWEEENGIDPNHDWENEKISLND